MIGWKPDVHGLEDPESLLERGFIEEFLRARGLDSGGLNALPEDQRLHLLREASVYAAGKLAEVEARAHFVREIHSED
jgi:hypothetical protein